MVAVAIEHIVQDERGIAYIAGTKMKVRQVITEMQAWNLSAEGFQEAHPHLSLGQIYAALSYYHDHKTHIDAERQQEAEEVERLRLLAGESPFVERMRSEGLLP